MLEPAAPPEGTPAAAAVAPTSLASRPVSVRLREPKLSSQRRDVMSTLPTRQVTESASTEIFVLGVKPNEVLPRNRRAITRLSKRAHRGRMLCDHRGQRQSGWPGCAACRCGRSILQNRERQYRNNQLLHLHRCSLHLGGSRSACSSKRVHCHPGHRVNPDKMIFDGLNSGDIFRGRADRPRCRSSTSLPERCTTPLRTTTLIRPTRAHR